MRAPAAAIGALAAVLVGLSPARADEPPEPVDPLPEPATASGQVVLAAGARWSWAIAHAPRLERQLGVVVLAELDRAAGRRPHGALITGEPVVAPPGWPIAAAGPHQGPAPLAASDDDGRCGCATRLPRRPDQRVAVLWASTTFRVDQLATPARVLVVRVRYRDGLIIHVNGLEVARRGIDGAGLAAAPRGPEWEELYVPVAPGLLRAGDNQLAVEVRPSGRSVAPSLELELRARAAPQVIRGPVLARPRPDQAVVDVETDVPTALEVRWGRVGAATSTLGSRGRLHRVTLPGLVVGAAYQYQVVAGGVPGPVVRFAGPVGPGTPVRIAVYGDVRGGHGTHGKLVELMRSEAPHAVIATGDLVLRGSDDGDWQRFFAVAGPLLAELPFYPAMGNHDLGRGAADGRRFTDRFVLPAGPPDRPEGGGWYAVDVGDVHLVLLDSGAYELASQRSWLEADLVAARARGVRAIIAATHDGPWSRGIHGGSELARREIVPLLVRHRVDLLLSGHDHLYQRGRADGLNYLVSGGGGASLYPVKCGVRGRPRCRVDDGATLARSAHHYLLVTVGARQLELCPRLLDGSPLEPCTTLALAAPTPP